MFAPWAIALAVTVCISPHTGQGLFYFNCYMKNSVIVFALLLFYLTSKCCLAQLIIPTLLCKKCYALSGHTAILKPTQMAAETSWKSYWICTNLNFVSLWIVIGTQLTWSALRNIWHWLCPFESSRKYLYFLCIYTIILSLYQLAEKGTHGVGLVFSFVTSRTADIFGPNLNLCVQTGSILGEK